MTRHRQDGPSVRAVAMPAVMLAVAVGLATGGCTASPRVVSRSAEAAAPVAVPLAAGAFVPGASWATVRTGGPSVGGRFWQLLAQDRATGKWRLVTPPGVADNAGLAVTSAPDGTMTAGFVPGQLLKFSPLARSTDDGAHWAQGLLPAGLAADPDSLAALPDGRLVAVTPTEVEESAAGVAITAAKNWASLVTLRALAATPGGRRCGLTSLTGTAAVPDGSALVSGTCSRPGRLGLFSNTGGNWQAIDPLVSRSAKSAVAYKPAGGPATRPESVLGLDSSTAGVSVLIDVGTGSGHSIVGARLAAGAKAWTFYPLAGDTAGAVTSVSGSPSGGWVVMLNGSRAVAAEPAAGQPANSASARATSFLAPGPDATIVPSASGGFTALVPGLSTVTVWQQGASGWHRTQTIDVASAPAGPSS
ncbi:MAG TPA: hypothetical protein VGM14_17140 [Streptosporangiaceae bacterium]